MRLAIYMATMVAVWFVAGVYRADVLMALAVGMALLLACSFVLARVAARMLDVFVTAGESQAVRGEAAHFSLRTENRCVLPVSAFDVRLELGYRNGQVAASGLVVSGVVSGRAKVSVPVFVDAPHCGVMWVRVDRVTARDPLGLFAARKRLVAQRGFLAASMPVMPARLGIRDTQANTSGPIAGPAETADALRRLGVLPPDVEQVRVYRPGDPLHTVHWKLSARSQDVFVKEFPDERGIDALLLCDLGLRPGCAATPDDYDAFVTQVEQLSRGLLAAGLTHALAWLGRASSELPRGGTGSQPDARLGGPSAGMAQGTAYGIASANGAALDACGALVREESDVERAIRSLVGSGVPYEAPCDGERIAPDAENDDGRSMQAGAGRAAQPNSADAQGPAEDDRSADAPADHLAAAPARPKRGIAAGPFERTDLACLRRGARMLASTGGAEPTAYASASNFGMPRSGNLGRRRPSPMGANGRSPAATRSESGTYSAGQISNRVAFSCGEGTIDDLALEGSAEGDAGLYLRLDMDGALYVGTRAVSNLGTRRSQ